MSARRASTLLAAVFALLATVPAVAHHSVGGVFDESKQLVLKGTFTKIEWINPHIHLYLNTTEPDGTKRTWEIETFPTNWMRKAGITKATVWGNAEAGEVVTLNVNPARDASMNLAYLIRITYPDGHFIHVTGDPAKIASN
jgi:hypothetical protein